MLREKKCFLQISLVFRRQYWFSITYICILLNLFPVNKLIPYSTYMYLPTYSRKYIIKYALILESSKDGLFTQTKI